MKLHEYQAKELLARFGVPVPKGRVARTPEEAEAITRELGGTSVIKAQAHTGARGRAGGVKVAKSPEEARQHAQAILGMQLVTHQTGPQGLPVSAVLVEELVDIEREIYLSVAIDNTPGMPVIIASAQGGMDIEEVAANTPEALFKQYVDPACGFQGFQGRTLAFAVGLDGQLLGPATQLIAALVRAFEASDGSIAEINPVVVTKDGRLLAADAKFSIDDNADYRQKALADTRDRTQEDDRELEAHDAGIQNYVALDGNIGCLVNGAGLAMATMDAIKFAGGEPANFLDIGTQNDPAVVASALRLIGSDPSVKAVLVNVFGGLARTDVIAEGVVQAKRQGLIPQPTVVRLAGTNVELGMQILKDATDVEVIHADGFAEAATKAVAASRGER
ncbi:MAG: ADP-forming succinate--CoA ligase subunit beta [Chloroflexi bacterium]|nr:MAG: ADP-forming succinate--CoA ligase subunit beta [Chloroflexota bacterium]